MFQFQCSLSLPFLACQYYTVDYCIFVSLYSGNKPVRGCTAGVQGRVSRWNELRLSSTVPFFGRSACWSGGEAFGRRKEQYSTVRECCSTCLSNYGSRTCHCYVMAPPPTPKSYKYSSPFGLGVAWWCAWVCGWWERFSQSGVHRIGNPGIVCRPQTQPRVVARPWDPSRSLDDLYNKLIL